MLIKKQPGILLLSLLLTIAVCFSALADEEESDISEYDTEDSSLIVNSAIEKMWEQAADDSVTGPAFWDSLAAAMAGDPDEPEKLTGIATAVIGSRETGVVNQTQPEYMDDADAYAALAYADAFAAYMQALQQANQQSTISNEPVTDIDGAELIPLGKFAITKYCPCTICGNGSGMTASGKHARSNHTIAADTRLYPFGTRLMVNGIIYTVEDTGGSVRGNTLDIFVDSHAEATSYGTRYADVYLVK